LKRVAAGQVAMQKLSLGFPVRLHDILIESELLALAIGLQHPRSGLEVQLRKKFPDYLLAI